MKEPAAAVIAAGVQLCAECCYFTNETCYRTPARYYEVVPTDTYRHYLAAECEPAREGEDA